jgi:hypothetical protein
MSELEWYLDVDGKQSGPLAAREIVEMVKSGKIPATSQVTAARMNGDWVQAKDLVDAYAELYAKPVAAAPVSGAEVFTSRTTDSNFSAPPRPTEQLEKSKIITLDREALDNTPDPTDALFQAIQAVREKANVKGSTSPSSPSSARDSSSKSGLSSAPRIPPQLLLILALAGIFGITIYGLTKLVKSRSPEVNTASTAEAEPEKIERSAAPRSAPRKSGLLDTSGAGESAARTAPPVQAVKRRAIPPMGNMPTRPVPADPRDLDGGARYRDERDNLPEDVDYDENELDPRRDYAEPVPVDPSQVPSDRIIDEPRPDSMRRREMPEDRYPQNPGYEDQD